MLGIFDSGSGGLTVLSQIRKRLPDIDVIYLGDIANAPYGSKSREELGALTVASIKRLLDEGATNIVSACNSVSSSIVLPTLSILSIKPFDIIEMVGPTVSALRSEKRNILLLATEATIQSGIYQNGFKIVGKNITTLPCPQLAAAIEFGKSEKDIEKIIRQYLTDKNLTNIEMVVLGCTHYPLVTSLFKKVLGGHNVEIYDPAVAVADEVVKRMAEAGAGMTKFLITKDSQFFRDRIKKIKGSNLIII